MTTATQQTAAAANELNEKHFEMLRLAKLRGVKVRKLGDFIYAVTSYSRSGLEWVYTNGVCSCPARGYCTHIAAVVDYYFVNEASPTDCGHYIGEGAADRARFLSRIHRGTLTRNDKTYLRYCVRFAERRMCEREAVKAPTITKTTIKEGSRTRTVERVGAFTI